MRPAAVAVVDQLHAGAQRRHLAGAATRSTPWKTESVSSRMAVLRRAGSATGGAGGAVGIEDELAALAGAEPGDAGDDRHAPGVEQARVVHHHHQPLREALAVGAAELGHVGVHGELLAGHRMLA